MTDLDTTGLRQVGEFHNFSRKRLIRSPKNPMDRCTVVSILPKYICEIKHTIEPGIFKIEPGTYEKPSILVVGSSSWWKELDAAMPVIEIPNSSIQVAQSIVQDYCNGMLGCDMGDSMPGLFFVLGETTVAKIKTDYKNELERAKTRQDNWYQILVKFADSLWARTNGNPLTISDEMRLAARSLNLNEKVWLKDFQIMEMTKCPACGSLRNPAFPVCPTCKYIDNTNPLSKDMKFAV